MKSGSCLTCAIHTGIRKTIFCNECDQSLCFICQSLPQHQGHSFCYLKSTDNNFIISAEKAHETIRNRQEMAMQIQKDLTQKFQPVKTKLDNHRLEIINQTQRTINKRVRESIEFLKLLGEKELNSFNEITENFKEIVDSHEKSKETESSVNFYNRDLLQRFFADENEINVKFVPGKREPNERNLKIGYLKLDGIECSVMGMNTNQDESENDAPNSETAEESKLVPRGKKRKLDDVLRALKVKSKISTSLDAKSDRD